MSTFYRILSSEGSEGVRQLADGRTIRTSWLVSLMLIIILILNLSMKLLAQQNDIKFECISVEQGLSKSLVYSITQDRQGFMWFATESGRNRYDGYNITVYKYDPFDTTTISGILIFDVIEDHFGNMMKVMQ